ncbi:hypothetical protein DTO006G1_8468 [Penicillium roqueforti]|uniref:Protein BNI4 n=1 Tax=Penicillium roqueforti (strain FM164) TaxID=1365484 RepID=W6QMB0_PENRF|nr:uncharacterized protein LCP9604111_3857 [Penicillium roqueforti]CDM37993.1 unnamed protein product [Penicillium roqueforti FM164]KAF9249757.1 hypothetical protein LCP9604111_3857 [Penicillium roqueforti]KAI1829845.1 hypothetical protein CBS147337_9352 [Penicillium roqueforti]KAI2669900.1 hypothetical protein CBS147355_9630 [Penicillium roqueforti]KAI2685013.1 hypothetical protein LCP963914a_5105 [Penicillium roqueforti]
MAALVQTIPQQSGTVPVLQTRPSSSSGTFSSSTQNQGSRIQTMSWTSFNAGNSGTYRAGHPVVAPYAYNPNMGQSVQNRQSWTPHLRPEHRTFSAPTTPQVPVNPTYTGASPRSSHPAAGSVSNPSNSSSRSYVSKDDSALPSRPRSDQPLRPLSTANLPSPPIMNISSPKPSPNRYRRTPQRAEAAPSSPAPSPIPTVIVDDFGGPRPVRPSAHSRVSSVDDSSYVDRAQPERYRRRSLGNMDAAAYPNLPLDFPTSPSSQPQSGSYDFITFDANQRPASSHSQRDSVGSVNSTHSSASSAREGTPSESNSVTSKTGKAEEKRTSKPSPLSQPVSTEPEAPKPKPPAEAPKKPPPPTLDSPAAKRLNDLKMDTKRPGKSRLRRAFSFGSASELLKTSAQSNASKREAFAADQARREALREQLGPEQAAIAEQQELSGLGESIYSHQGHFFTGSNDNLSVSSTASSASMMLRKMGKGMKRSTRSLVGMFRPKSVASINSMEGAIPEIPAPQITVVNVEAERERVAVNPDPADLPRGATVFPKVDNASEVRRSVSIRERAASENSQSRKSIMGGDRERAEILAAVRKGILKKTHSDFGVSSPAHALPGSDSPHSSAPPTPDESSRSPAHQNDPVKIAGEDYFLSARFSSSEAKSAPITPSNVAGRNIVFSPRIQFHETWPSGEYDRRGEIATCNRLTPLLAQQIREEINNFKMEMEVHENSKIYTHFI